MAIDMFLKLDGVKGDSDNDRHKDEIDVLAWGWGMSQSGRSTPMGIGLVAEKVSVNDLSVTKYVDRSSPTLILSCCSGKYFAEGVLTVSTAGESRLEYIRIIMKNVRVASISTGGNGGEDRVTESVMLNFTEFRFEYTPQKDDGSGDATIEVGWDIEANIPK